MRYRTKVTLALGFVGMVAMAAVAFGQSTTSSAPSTPSGAQAARNPARQALRQRMGNGARAGKLGGRVVTGEFKVKTPKGFATVHLDAGTVSSVSGNTLVLKRADDQTVTVTATDQTRIRRDRARATMADIKPGDQVRVLQVDDGSGMKVRAIRARSASSSAAGTQQSDFLGV